jgi:hypothetical protein
MTKEIAVCCRPLKTEALAAELCLVDGGLAEVKDNHHAQNTIRLDHPVTTCMLKIENLATGTAASPAVFSIRCFAQPLVRVGKPVELGENISDCDSRYRMKGTV